MFSNEFFVASLQGDQLQCPAFCIYRRYSRPSRTGRRILWALSALVICWLCLQHLGGILRHGNGGAYKDPSLEEASTSSPVISDALDTGSIMQRPAKVHCYPSGGAFSL